MHQVVNLEARVSQTAPYPRQNFDEVCSSYHKVNEPACNVFHSTARVQLKCDGTR